MQADPKGKSWAGRRRPRSNAASSSAVAASRIAALAENEKTYYDAKLKMEQQEHEVRMKILLLQEQFEIKRLKTMEE